MKKSSLGRRSSNAPHSRHGLSEFEITRRDRMSSIPVRSRASSADRNTTISNLTMMRSKSNSNLRVDNQSYNNYNRRLTGGGTERPVRSMTMSSGTMRTSSYGGMKHKTDSRPLQNKEWQATALRKVENVLKSIPEGRTLIKTSIKPLTNKLFVDIADLLFSKLDMNISLNSSNFVNEIPFLTRAMGYRGKVDKSWLISANTPHAFAHVLGLFDYLVSCYEALIQVDPMTLMYPENFCGSTQDSWNFTTLLPYLHESYECYNSGREDYPQIQLELDKKFLKLHFEDNGLLDNQTLTLEAECVKLGNSIQQKRNENQILSREVNDLKKSYEEIMNDYESQMKRVSFLEEDIEQTESAIADTEYNYGSLKTTLENNKIIRNKLQENIENQCISKRDIEELRKKCSSVKYEIESEGKYVEIYSNKVFNEDLAITTLQRKLENVVKNYVLILEEVLDESSLEKSKIPLNINELEIKNIEDAFAGLMEIKSKYNNKQKEFGTEETQGSSIQELNAEIAKLQFECDSVEEKINVNKEEVNTLRVQHMKKISQSNTDLALIEDKCNELKKNIPDDNYEELAKRENITADEMEIELQEYGRRTNLIISEKIRLYKKYEEEVRSCFDRFSLCADELEPLFEKN